MIYFSLYTGTLKNPLEKEQKLLIVLRASEGVFCDRFNGIHIDPGTIGESIIQVFIKNEMKCVCF